MDSITARSIPDQVFERLSHEILAGSYAPGDPLPGQRALAAELEVNLASVREALGRLEQIRLIEVRHGDATRVRDWRRNGGLEVLALFAGADPEAMASVFEARRLLLVEAARLAAGRRDPAQVESLGGLVRTIAETADRETALLADWEFMSVVVEASGNLAFRLIMNSVREIYLPQVSLFAGLMAGHGEPDPAYEFVASAIADADAEGAADAMAGLVDAQERRISGEPGG